MPQMSRYKAEDIQKCTLKTSNKCTNLVKETLCLKLVISIKKTKD